MNLVPITSGKNLLMVLERKLVSNTIRKLLNEKFHNYNLYVIL